MQQPKELVVRVEKPVENVLEYTPKKHLLV
jgi:hypothetical protein